MTGHTKMTGWWADDTGQDLIEYALIAGLIGTAAITCIKNLAMPVGSAFSMIGSKMSSSLSF